MNTPKADQRLEVAEPAGGVVTPSEGFGHYFPSVMQAPATVSYQPPLSAQVWAWRLTVAGEAAASPAGLVSPATGRVTVVQPAHAASASIPSTTAPLEVVMVLPHSFIVFVERTRCAPPL
jgi:hypothetical protein